MFGELLTFWFDGWNGVIQVLIPVKEVKMSELML